MRHTLFQVAIDEHLLYILQAVEHALMQRADAQVLRGHLFAGDAVGLTHANDLVRRQRARAHATLVTTTVHLRLDAHTRLASHVQGANAFGAVGLVRCQAHQVHRQGAQVDFHATGGLRCIDVKNNVLFAAQRTNGGNVLDHANLVVDEHDTDQNRVRPDRSLQHFQVKQPVCLHVEVAHFKALPFQLAAGIEHRLVLGLDRDDVLAPGLVEAGRAFERQVVGLGGTGGPDDLARIRTNQGRHLLTRSFHRGFRLPAPGMTARRRVAKVLAQPRNHGVHHPLIAGVGGAVIHVNWKVGSGIHDGLTAASG